MWFIVVVGLEPQLSIFLLNFSMGAGRFRQEARNGITPSGFHYSEKSTKDTNYYHQISNFGFISNHNPLPLRTPYLLLTFANPLNVPKAYLAFLNRESALVYQHLEHLALEDKCDVNRIPDATVEQVFDTIEKWQKRKDLVLFHYGGHASGEDLFLITESGDSRAANAEGFAELLGSLPSLQLVFLNGCSTKGQVDLLLRKGVKAVIATAAPVQDEMAVDFAGRFYQNLAAGASIGMAFGQARTFLMTKYHHKVLTLEESRSLAFEEVFDDALPWGIYVQKGAESVLEWRLPQEKLNRSQDEIEKENQLNTELLSQINVGLEALKPIGEAARFPQKLVLALVVVLGVGLSLLGYLTWQNQSGAADTFDLSLYFYDGADKSAFIESGVAKVIYDQAPDVAYPIRGGKIELKNLSKNLRGESLKINPAVTGYAEEQIVLTVPKEGNLLEVVLPEKTYQSEIQGSVRNRAGQPVEGAWVIMGKDTSFTNMLGDFEMTVVVPFGQRQRMRIIYNNEEVYNGEETISPNPIHILLRK